MAPKAGKRKAAKVFDEELAAKARKLLQQDKGKKPARIVITMKKAPAKGIVLESASGVPEAATNMAPTRTATSTMVPPPSSAALPFPPAPTPSTAGPSAPVSPPRPVATLGESAGSPPPPQPPHLASTGRQLPRQFVQDVLQHAYNLAPKVDEAEFNRLVSMPTAQFLGQFLGTLFTQTLAAKARASDSERGFYTKADIEKVKDKCASLLAERDAKHESALASKEDDIRRLQAQVIDLERSLTQAVARVSELEAQADNLAASNLSLSSDKAVLQAQLEDTLQSLCAKRKNEKALEENLAQAGQALAEALTASKEFEEQAVNGFIKGYRHAQGEILEKDPDFDGSWMSLGFDKGAILSGDEEEEEEEEEAGVGQGPAEGRGVEAGAVDHGPRVGVDSRAALTGDAAPVVDEAALPATDEP